MIKLFLSKQNGSLSSHADFARLEEKFPGMAVLHSFGREEHRAAIVAQAMGHRALVLAGPEHSFYEAQEGMALLADLLAAGFNRNQVVILDLATLFGADTEANTSLALRLLELASQDAANRRPFETRTLQPDRRVVVIGSSPAGILAARRLAAAGLGITMVGRGGIPSASGWWEKEAEILEDAGVTLLPFTALKGFAGLPGAYRLEVEKGGVRQVLECGAVVLATGSDTPHNQEIHQALHLPLGTDKRIQAKTAAAGEFRTRYPQVLLLPADTDRDLLPAKLEPPLVSLRSFLDQQSYTHQLDIVTVEETVCGACGTCVKTCIFGASTVDPVRRVSVVDPEKCVGCGNCVTACPTGARELLSYPSAVLYETSRRLAPEKAGSGVMVFACEGSGYPAIEGMRRLGQSLPAGFTVSRIRCGARMDAQFISEAMNEGFAGVAVVCCKETVCQNLIGSLDLARRLNLYRAVLRARGLDANLLRIITIDRNDIDGTAAALAAFARTLGG
jgi:coenzyme F420-reducing hydrogenase delta subunit/NAD-dependent dihydropyrimidine dehydrogenase PreA subunit